MNAPTTLSVALLFAGIFLLVRRGGHRPHLWSGERFLSLAAGLSVAYVFVHVLPALERIREFQTLSPAGFKGFFPQHSVYLWTMAGFVVFYGLDNMGEGPGNSGRSDAPAWRVPALIGGFVVYAWLLTFLMVWTGKGGVALGLYAVAMGMHLFPIAHNLRADYANAYDRRGAFLLAAASFAGWACAVTLSLPESAVLTLSAFVAGGVIVNGAMSELPRERGGRYGWFLGGAAIYTVLLITLSNFE